MSLRTGNGYGFQLAGFDVLGNMANANEHHLNLTAHDIDQRGRITLVGGRERCRCLPWILKILRSDGSLSQRGRSKIKRTGVGLGIGCQFCEVLCGYRVVHHQRQGNSGGTADMLE
jgi:type V secretory pathway adhesin AidA